MTTKEVADMVKLSSGQIMKLWRQRKFPRPVRLSERRFAWRKSDILEWMADLKKAEVKHV